MLRQSILIVIAISLTACAPDSAIRPYKFDFIKITGDAQATVKVHNCDTATNSPEPDHTIPYTLTVPIDSYHFIISSMHSALFIDIENKNNKIEIPPRFDCEITFKDNILNLNLRARTAQK
jgi:hypothetical protein